MLSDIIVYVIILLVAIAITGLLVVLFPSAKSRPQGICFLFLALCAAGFGYCRFFAYNVFVITDKQHVKNYILIKETNFETANLSEIKLSRTGTKNIVINNTPDVAYFDLIIYSRRGDNSAAYGHETIAPYSKSNTIQRPNYFVNEEPPSSISTKSDTEVKGWLHW
ncbi:MAG: hypothetical protein J0I41_21700 [Filimonas sp.]|nr:hypothetical protein [Filimonas sp.]